MPWKLCSISTFFSVRANSFSSLICLISLAQIIAKFLRWQSVGFPNFAGFSVVGDGLWVLRCFLTNFALNEEILILFGFPSKFVEILVTKSKQQFSCATINPARNFNHF